MGQTPSTFTQAVVLIVLVLPGVTYQFLRERWRGPVPGERDLAERVLRAITASVVLDAVYLIALGPVLTTWLASRRPASPVLQHPRMTALLALCLLVLVPTLTAWMVTRRQQRRSASTFLTAPTAWDHAFRDRTSCFVRARLKDGSWIGGWYGNRSYDTSFPQSPELFLEGARHMEADGNFGQRVARSGGILIRGENVDVIEFVETPATQEDA